MHRRGRQQEEGEIEEMERGGVGGGGGRERSVPVHLQQNRATDLGETGTAPTYT